MKLTESKLREIIKEELKSTSLNEAKLGAEKHYMETQKALATEYKKKVKVKKMDIKGEYKLSFGLNSFHHGELPTSTISVIGGMGSEITSLNISFSSSNIKSVNDIKEYMAYLQEVDKNWNIILEYFKKNDALEESYYNSFKKK